MKGCALLNKKIRNLVDRVEDLRLHTRSSSNQGDLLHLALQELLGTLEELQQANEEVQQQNAELLSSQETLAAERQRYLQLFELAPDAYLVTDTQGAIREANRRAGDLLGLPQGFLVGKPLAVFIHTVDRLRFSGENLKDWPPRQEKQDWEFLLQPRKGSPFAAHLTVMPERSLEGTLVGFRWLVRDISGLKKAAQRLQEALGESECRQRETLTLLQSAQAVLKSRNFRDGVQGVFELCKDLIGATAGWFALFSEGVREHEVLFLNAGGLFCTQAPSLVMPMRGLREEAFLTGKPVYENIYPSSKWAQFLPPGHVPIESALLAPLIMAGEAKGFFCLANKSGGFTDKDLHLASAFSEMLTTALAIAQAGEALRESEEGYRSLLDFFPDAMAVHTDRFIFVNPAWVRLFGAADPEEIIGTSVLERVHPDYRDLIRQRIKNVLAKKKPSELREIKILRLNGQAVEVEATSRAITYQGKPSVLVVLRDITQRKQAEDAIRRAHDDLEQQVQDRTADLAQAHQELTRQLQQLQEAEGAVRAERQRLFSLLEALPVFVYLRSPDYTVHYANRLFKDTFREIQGRKCYEIMAGRPDPCDNCQSCRVLETGNPETWEWTRVKQGQTFQVYSHFFADTDGSPLALTMGLDITERKQGLEDLRRREAILEAVSYSAGILLETKSWQASIPEILKRLGEAAKVSRVYIFENRLSEDHTLLTSQRSEWAAPHITHQMDNPALQNFPWQASGMGRWETMMAQGQIISGDIEEFPDCEQEILALQDIYSLIAVPIFVDRQWWGFIGFDQCFAARHWTAGEVDALKTAAGLLGSAIQRQQAEEALRQREAQYRLLAENVSDVIWTADLSLRPTYVSPSVQQLLGFTPEEMMAKSLEAIFTPSSLEMVFKTFAEALALEGQQPVDLNRSWTLELEHHCKDGSTVWTEFKTSFLRGSQGQPVGILGVTRDISRRRQAEEALRASEAQVRTIFEQAAMGITLRDLEGRLIACNPAFQSMVGYREEDLKDRDFSDITHPEDLEEGLRLFGQLTAGQLSHYHREKRYLCKDGKILWAKVSPSLVRDPSAQPRLVITMFEDITEHKRAEERLRDSEQNLRYLTSQLLTAQERERARIALELHDDLGQSLTFLKLLMREIRKKLPADHLTLLKEYDHMRGYIDGVIHKVRGLSRELMPSLLQDLGLLAALKYLFGEFSKYQEMKVSLDLEDVESLFSKEEHLVIYRIFQEALHNIAKHARAKRVEAAIKKLDGCVSFTIGDDGQGFVADKIGGTSTRGLGLASMEERVRMLGGSLQLRSQEGQGTKISFTVPIRQADSDRGGQN